MTMTGPTHPPRLRSRLFGALAPLVLLALAAGPARADDAFEDNDTCAQAVAYAGGPGTLFVSDTDPDWFVITAQAGARMVVDLERTGGGGNPEMELYSACGGAPVAGSYRAGATESIALEPSLVGPAGSYRLRVWMFHPGSCSYKLRISYQAPPDGDVTTHPVGWSAPLVPFSTLPPNYDEVTLPTVLTPPISLVVNIRTSAVGYLAGGMPWTFWMDDVFSQGSGSCPSCGTPSGDDVNLLGGTSPYEGGRHTGRIVLDPDGLVAESNETNNEFVDQWVWAPAHLATGAPHGATEPPRPGSLPLPNCDGYDCVRGNTAWVVAMAPETPSRDYGLYLYRDYQDSRTGFSDVAVGSEEPAGGLKLLVGTRASELVHFYPGVRNLGPHVTSGGIYRIEMDEATATNSDQPAALWTDMTLDVNDPVDVFEGRFVSGATYHFSLTRGFGTADLAFALYPSASATAMPRADRLADGHATAADLDELDWSCPADGWYPIVVHRPNEAAPLDAAGYSFGWTTTTSGTPEPPTTGPALALRVLENPVRDRLRLALDLPAGAGPARLAVYDVVGREIARLDASALSKGPTGTLAWTPRAEGRRLAAGTYFVRVTAGARSAVQRFELR